MKIFILFSIYFLCSSCYSASNRDLGPNIVVKIFYKQGVRALNFTRVENILINSETPIWNARYNNSSNEIEYIKNEEIMSTIGDFQLYQDYANKSAIAVFSKNNITKGWMQDSRFENFENSLDDPEYFGNLSVSFNLPKQDSPLDSEGLLIDNKKRERTPPEVIYPEMLIQLAYEDVRDDPINAVMTTIASWNAADMLFSRLENPRIRLNIAGIIIPEDIKSAPWVKTHMSPGPYPTQYVNSQSYDDLGKYFSSLRHQFPDSSYDYVVSYVSIVIGDDSKPAVGKAWVGVPCWNREKRAVLLTTNQSPFVAAHELGHLFSSSHDEKDQNCNRTGGIMMSCHLRRNFEWSVCSKRKFFGYFGRFSSACLDNCPSTMKNCPRPRKPSCLPPANNICTLSRYNYVENQTITCAEGLRCRDFFDSSIEILAPIPDWTIAEWNSTGSPSAVCVGRSKIPYPSEVPPCQHMENPFSTLFG